MTIQACPFWGANPLATLFCNEYVSRKWSRWLCHLVMGNKSQLAQVKPLLADLMLLKEPQIDWIVQHRGRILMSGGILFAVALGLPAGWGCGGLTGFMLSSLAIYAYAFRRWRTEPGIWMLALFLTVLLTPCWAYFEFLHVNHIRNRANVQAMDWGKVRLMIDAAISLVVFSVTIRFAMGVALGNWKRTSA